jgi:hypothetical protein
MGSEVVDLLAGAGEELGGLEVTTALVLCDTVVGRVCV